jgi:hypothetical protein
MGAGVAGENRGAAMLGQLACHSFVSEKGAQLALHLASVFRDEKIFSRGEKLFAVLPRRTDEGDATGERFEGTDGWNSGKSFDIGASWNVNRDVMSGERFRNPKVR